MKENITLAHGSGGLQTHRLIQELFLSAFNGGCTETGDDAAKLALPAGQIAFTTDSFVVSPLFFPGGDIGKLAVCGTVNDLCTSGAVPLYLSCGFIMEEGFPVPELERVVHSMAEAAKESGVRIVTGDTKVVQKGAADGLFINTSGIGALHDGVMISGSCIRTGDKIILSGPAGDHGAAILLARDNFGFNAAIHSDCAPLNGMIACLSDAGVVVHAMRDPTRGGVATALNEMAAQSGVFIRLREKDIPVRREVRGICSLLGLDPLYLACEGRMLLSVSGECEQRTLEALRGHPYGREARTIGEVADGKPGRVAIVTSTGGSRVLDMLSGEHLPRIC